MKTIDYKKKSALLKKKIIASSAITHNTHQFRIDELLQQQQQMKHSLQLKVQELVGKLKEKGEIYLSKAKNLNSWVSQDNKGVIQDHSLIKSEQLKKYLNTEKNALKELIESQGNEVIPTKVYNLHEIVKKKRLQEILLQVQTKQLEKQVKYLSTHVINSSGIIYVPETTITIEEETQLNDRLGELVAEVERMTYLDIVCATQQRKEAGGGMDHILGGLEAQNKRLELVFDFLSHEKGDISNFESSLENLFGITKSFPPMLEAKTQKMMVSHCQIDDEQLEIILNRIDLQNSANILNKQSCSNEQLNNSLKTLRNKLKSFE